MRPTGDSGATSRQRAWVAAVALWALVPFLATCGRGSSSDGTPAGSTVTPTPLDRSVVVDVPLSALIDALHEPLPTLAPTGTASPRGEPAPSGSTAAAPAEASRARATESGAGVGDVIVLTPVPCEMVSVNDTEQQGVCCPPTLRSGSSAGREFLTALSFDLTDLPMGVEVLYAGLELTGLDAEFLAERDDWYIQLIDLPPAGTLGDLTFSQILAAPAADPGAVWRLRSEQLAPGGRNTLQFGQQALDALALRLGQGKVTFRIEGPGGRANLFAWQSCGEDAPRLRVGYLVMPGTAEVRWESTASP